MIRYISIYTLIISMSFILGCDRDKIESVPVDEISVSVPPKVLLEDKFEDNIEKKYPYDESNVWLPDENRKVYDVVVPKMASMIFSGDKETNFYVPGMQRDDVDKFINKYFPYQKYDAFYHDGSFKIYSKFKDEYLNNERIVPDLNPNVFRPRKLVYIDIYFNKKLNAYEWDYYDPDYAVRMEKKHMDSELKKLDLEYNSNKTRDPLAISKICHQCIILTKKKNNQNDINVINERNDACETCRKETESLTTEQIELYKIPLPNIID